MIDTIKEVIQNKGLLIGLFSGLLKVMQDVRLKSFNWIVALTDIFVQEKQGQWDAFLKRNRLETSAPELFVVVKFLRNFFIPLFEIIVKNEK